MFRLMNVYVDIYSLVLKNRETWSLCILHWFLHFKCLKQSISFKSLRYLRKWKKDESFSLKKRKCHQLKVDDFLRKWIFQVIIVLSLSNIGRRQMHISPSENKHIQTLIEIIIYLIEIGQAN